MENQGRLPRNRQLIAEGVALVEKALSSRRFGPCTLQAAIAAVHAETESAAATDWRGLLRFTTNWLEFSLRRLSISTGPCNCHARWSRGRSDAYQRGAGTRRIGELLLGAFRPCRYVRQARQDG